MSERLGPVLILGGNGMLGRAWRALLDRNGIQYSAPSRKELDISRSADVERAVERNLATVINCAGWTDVDGAESQLETAQLINGSAVGDLARRCAATNTPLVHYSTDYVFDGQGSCPYTTNHPVRPINAYGRSKLIGEQLIAESGCRHLIVRTSWLYAPWGHNFVRTIVKLASEREVLTVVDDQRGRPTSSEGLAETTLKLIENGATGLFHVTDGGDCSWFEFAREIAAHTAPNCRIDPCRTSQFPRPAKRPAYSLLDLTSTEALVGAMPHWKKNLADVLTHLEPLVSESRS